MNEFFKRTKILATIGPSVFGQEKIDEIIMAGVNGCRLNCSHGTNEERDEQIKWIRKAAEKKGRSVAILQDLQGPKIRLGEILDNHLDLKAGDEVILDRTIELPQSAAGECTLYLNLPDPEFALRNNPLFSIRLANKDSMWEEETGYNKLIEFTL